MQTEDYIYQDDIAHSRYPLSKKHSIAIAVTALLACSFYFVIPQNTVKPTTTSFYGASVPDESGYDDLLDPTRSLTDLLLTDEGEIPASSDEVRFSSNNNNQRVYTAAGAGSMENYDEDVGVNLEYTEESALEERLRALASAAGDDSVASSMQVSQWISEEVQRGDTLSSIFSDLNVPYSVLMTLSHNENQEAAESLTNIRPGNKLYFSFDRDNNLLGFIKQINGDEQWRFSRENVDQKFTVVREPNGAHIMVTASDGSLRPLLDGSSLPAYKKRGRLVIAEIKQGESFSTAAHDAGLTYAEIHQITDLFKGRVQFTRHIQPGDTLRVLFSEDKGKGKINAIELKLRKVGTLAAYRNEVDDKYYDERGYNSSTSTFRRFPLDGKVVISSQFNPNRRHPVTGKVRPHNGTDFAVRVGTPVISPADGVVEIAKYSRSAGYYVVIRHRGSYSTVYMHLSKLLVKPGQSVRIGQTIARSGNTGISTGPHLHYELRRNNHPINAMRVTLPANDDTTVAKKNRQRFESNVALFKKELYEDSLVAQNN